MRRVVITGMGIVSSIGNSCSQVLEWLKSGVPSFEFNEEYKELGLRSNVYGPVKINLGDLIDRKVLRFMGSAAAYNYIAMQEAIHDAGLEPNTVSNERTGLVTGSGGSSNENVIASVDILRNKGIRRVGPYMVPRTMTSTTSACLATPFKIRGTSYSISSACATSSHCIGHAAELIQWGKQDVMFAGGGEELHWGSTQMFDAMGALSTKYNDNPKASSRPYDANRDGFVISGGGGMVVLEELEHAKARGAKIYAELLGYGASSDGYDMVAPSGEGAVRCMQIALENISAPIDYLNTHGTSTPAGDTKELEAIRTAFSSRAMPTAIASTKSLTGHALGAAGVHEAIYSLLMLQHHFVAASANIEQLDPLAEGLPIVRTLQENVTLNTVMSNSFGFGGTNASLVFGRYNS